MNSDDDYLKECFSLFLSYGHFDPRRNGTIDVETLGEVFRAMGLDPSDDRLTEMKEMIARAGDTHGRGIDETV